jgi:hypothetical protein
MADELCQISPLRRRRAREDSRRQQHCAENHSKHVHASKNHL